MDSDPDDEQMTLERLLDLIFTSVLLFLASQFVLQSLGDALPRRTELNLLVICRDDGRAQNPSKVEAWRGVGRDLAADMRPVNLCERFGDLGLAFCNGHKTRCHPETSENLSVAELFELI